MQHVCKLVPATSAAVVAVGLLISTGIGNAAFGQSTPSGPVASNCTAEISKYCADKQHGAGAVRACLEADREHLSAQCMKALDTTGAGRGRMR